MEKPIIKKISDQASEHYAKILENIKAAEEFDELCKTSPDMVKQIFLDGMRTDFWRLFKGLLYRTKYSMEQNLQAKSCNTLDDLVMLGKFNTIYKQTDEIVNMPEAIVKTLLHRKEKPIAGGR